MTDQITALLKAGYSIEINQQPEYFHLVLANDGLRADLDFVDLDAAERMAQPHDTGARCDR